MSHHLKILVDAGILTREQRGKWAYYRLVPESLDTLAALITQQRFDASSGEQGTVTPPSGKSGSGTARPEHAPIGASSGRMKQRAKAFP